jgi:hypothetical protein
VELEGYVATQVNLVVQSNHANEEYVATQVNLVVQSNHANEGAAFGRS